MLRFLLLGRGPGEVRVYTMARVRKNSAAFGIKHNVDRLPSEKNKMFAR